MIGSEMRVMNEQLIGFFLLALVVLFLPFKFVSGNVEGNVAFSCDLLCIG